MKQEFKEAFVGLLFTHSRLIRKINQEVTARGAVAMDVYEVLLALEDAPDQSLNMSELLSATVLSPSGLTRLVDRMVKAGYVTRERSGPDSRCTYAKLTPLGYDARVRSWPEHRDAINNYFSKHLNEREAMLLSEIWARYGEYPRFKHADHEPNRR